MRTTGRKRRKTLRNQVSNAAGAAEDASQIAFPKTSFLRHVHRNGNVTQIANGRNAKQVEIAEIDSENNGSPLIGNVISPTVGGCVHRAQRKSLLATTATTTSESGGRLPSRLEMRSLRVSLSCRRLKIACTFLRLRRLAPTQCTLEFRRSCLFHVTYL